MAKGQISVEQLISYASIMALIVPLTFLFLTLTSLNQKDLDDKSLQTSLEVLASTIEKSYSLCSDIPTKRRVSLRFPENILSLSFEEIDGNIYLLANLEEGDSVLKKLSIKRTSVLDKFNIPELELRGNQVITVECRYVNFYELEVYK